MLVFFGMLGRWTAGLSLWALVLLAGPWALFTSALEWLFLVPIVPFWQPMSTLEQPYCLGLAGRAPWRSQGFAAVWGRLAVAGTVALAVSALIWPARAAPVDAPTDGE